MVNKTRNVVIPVVGAALAFQGMGCKNDKDDKSITDLLVGQWEITSLDGVSLPNDYKVTFEFQADNDFQICSFYTGLSYCNNGNWNWTDSDEDEIDMEWTDAAGDDYFADLKIESITEDQITGDFKSPDTITYEIVLEKIE